VGNALEDHFDKEDFDTEMLYDDPLTVVADARHPLVRRRSLSDCGKERVVIFCFMA